MIRLEIKEETLRRVEKILAGVPKGAQRAMAGAINRGLAKARTEAKKGARKVFTVKAGAFSEGVYVQVKKASAGDLAGYISFNGNKLPLYKFQVTPRSPGTGRKVRAALKKGGGGTFQHAFVAAMPMGHTGVFERTGEQGIEKRKSKTRDGKGNKHSEKIKERMGLAVPQMVGNEEVVRKLEKEAQEMVDKRVEHEISRILNGYGG